MAAIITVENVRDIIKTSLSDAVIDMNISLVEEKCGDCINSSYSDNIGLMIKTNLVAYLLYRSEGKQEVSSKKAPNGASVSYSVGSSKEGILENQYGRFVYDVDKNKCWQSLLPASSFFKSTKGRGRRSNRDC